MNKLKFLLAAGLVAFYSCSGDDNASITDPTEPTNPSGQLLLQAAVQAPEWGWTNNHIRIRRQKPDGSWEFISLPTINGIERGNQAYVNSGDKIKVVYDIGIDQNQCCILYTLKQGQTIIQTDTRCAANTEPFFTYFEFEVE